MSARERGLDGERGGETIGCGRRRPGGPAPAHGPPSPRIQSAKEAHLLAKLIPPLRPLFRSNPPPHQLLV